MNYYFIAAGVLMVLAFFVHTLLGDKEYRMLNPSKQRQNEASGEMFSIWLMGRCTFQMVSVDLLLSSLALLFMGFALIPYYKVLAQFIALLYGGYLFSWLLTLLLSKARPIHYSKVGQWMLFLIALILVLQGLS